MQLPRRRLALAGIAPGLVALAIVCAVGERANAQNEAPFTIRRPPDGATVREKVKVQIPLASIPHGGYVAYYIDGEFREGLAPTDAQRNSAKPGATFDYSWDTKAPYKARLMSAPEPAKDGEHEISVRLYAPIDNTSGASAVLKDTSSVKVNLANRINVGDQPIRLRYRFVDGQTRIYDRTGATSIVSGLTQGASGTDDQEMIGQRSQLTFAVEDKYTNGDAIVRNLLDSLLVRQSGQETFYPADSLPKALYQQITSVGKVTYQNASPSFDQFAALGLPVSATLELPILPEDAVRVGDKWRTENVSLDLPGTPPNRQPRVSVESTFADVEWQDNYPSARIHQHYEGSPSGPGIEQSGEGSAARNTVTVGNIEVINPKITFDQDIYVAYRFGTLVAVNRTVEVTGKTEQGVNTNGATPGMNANGGMPARSMGGPPPGMGRPGVSGMGGGPKGGGAMFSSGGSASSYYSRAMGQGSGPGGGMYSSGGSAASYYSRAMGQGRGGPMGPGGMSGGPGGAGGAQMRGPSTYGGAGFGAGTGSQPTQITLKSTTTTELKSTK